MSHPDFHAVSQYAALGAALAQQPRKPLCEPRVQMSGLEALGRYTGCSNKHPVSAEEEAANAVLASHENAHQAA